MDSKKYRSLDYCSLHTRTWESESLNTPCWPWDIRLHNLTIKIWMSSIHIHLLLESLPTRWKERSWPEVCTTNQHKKFVHFFWQFGKFWTNRIHMGFSKNRPQSVWATTNLNSNPHWQGNITPKQSVLRWSPPSIDHSIYTPPFKSGGLPNII